MADSSGGPAKGHQRLPVLSLEVMMNTTRFQELPLQFGLFEQRA
jgi:hypothetical protein